MANGINFDKSKTEYLVTINSDKTEITAEAEDEKALEMAAKLRKDGVKVDMCFISKGMKQKMQYANRLMIPYVILLGEDEVKNNLVAFKNMNTGEQVSISYEEALKILKKYPKQALDFAKKCI